MLLTDGDIGRPPCIDAEINGVRLLLRWNGSRPRVQYTSVLTAEEVQAIQDFTGESKGESTKGGPTRREELLQKVHLRVQGALPQARRVALDTQGQETDRPSGRYARRDSGSTSIGRRNALKI